MILLHCNFRIDKKYYAITKPLFERLNNKLSRRKIIAGTKVRLAA